MHFEARCHRQQVRQDLRNIHPLRGRKRNYNLIFHFLILFTKYSPLTGTKTFYKKYFSFLIHYLRNIHPLRGRKLKSLSKVLPSIQLIYEIFTPYGDENLILIFFTFTSKKFTKYSPLTGTKTLLVCYTIHRLLPPFTKYSPLTGTKTYEV